MLHHLYRYTWRATPFLRRVLCPAKASAVRIAIQTSRLLSSSLLAWSLLKICPPPLAPMLFGGRVFEVLFEPMIKIQVCGWVLLLLASRILSAGLARPLTTLLSVFETPVTGSSLGWTGAGRLARCSRKSTQPGFRWTCGARHRFRANTGASLRTWRRGSFLAFQGSP